MRYALGFLMLLSLVGCRFPVGHSPQTQLAHRPPNHADSGIDCEEYKPLPDGWVCGTGGTVQCAPGWRPYGLDSCVPEESVKKP